MHSPRPYGLFIEGEQPTDADNNLIASLAAQIVNVSTVSDLDTLKMVRTLPDGGYVTAEIHHDVFRIYVNKSAVYSPEFVFNGYAPEYIPMLYSGLIEKAQVLDDGEGVHITLTGQCRHRLANYGTSAYPQKKVQLQRFRVEYADQFKFFEPENKGIYFFSQYLKLRPTWYSGAMREAVQVLAGYGRQDLNNLPDVIAERAQVKIPANYSERIKAELKNIRLPAYSGIPDQEGKLQYSYGSTGQFISFDSKNMPWLIQAQSDGVYSMPLPIIPATATRAFREYIEQMGDDEILHVLDRFGGLPSGESFPTGNHFHAWRRAGVIVKVCESADFYQHSSMYTACGWSINSRGSEAFNTCWSFAENGLMHVYGYKLKLNLAAADNRGMSAAVSISPDRLGSVENLALVQQYMMRLSDFMDIGDQLTHVIQYKLRRVTPEQILERAYASNMQAEVAYWDDLEMTPIAVHAGNMARVSEGPVYWGLKDYPQSMGRLKFPEMAAKGCESFAMVSPEYDGPLVKCDTVMFGCYVEDQLKTIKYFIDDRTFSKQEESTFEDIMIVGEWEKTETSGQTGLAGYFYTSDFDDRTEISPSTIYTHIKGTDMGYGNPLYVTPPVLFMNGSVSRARYYKHEITQKTVSGFGVDATVCVPVFARDCLLYAYEESQETNAEYQEHVQHSMADATSYNLWTYDAIFHWMGNAGKGEPYPKDGLPVFVDAPRYSPQDSSGFADSGDWLGIGDGYLNVTGIAGKYTQRGSAHAANGVSIGGEAPYMPPFKKESVTKNNLKGKLNISMKGAEASTVHFNVPDAWYFAFSPVESGGSFSYFYRDCCEVVCGTSRYANISEKAGGERRKYWGYTNLADHLQAHIFIGVINE